MINKILAEKFPFAAKYFETLIKEDAGRFPQSIVFEGLDIIGQYMFSTELARVLNCEGDKTPNCTCINCGWIKDVKHPSVNIVSPINYKDDSTKTVISINQSKKITSSLRETSDYHRFFIFCDAKIKQRSANETENIKKYEGLGFNFPEENWTPMPVTQKIFKAEASNSLLKSIEEPPKRTTFIFLTKHKEDLISTIVSRSVVFKLSAEKMQHKSGGFNEIINTFPGGYPDFDIQGALEASALAENFIKTNEADIVDFLDDFQEYILDLLKANLNNDDAVKMFEYHIKLVQTAKKRIMTSMSPKVVLESMFLDFVRPNSRADF